ncbi:MAG: tRNA lysidine(34) synthetase TilS [Arenimonas sp.]
MEVGNLPADSSENNALLEKLRAQLDIHGKKFLCAFSGGLDSSVLLHATAQIPGIQLRAIHIHHGLHPDADQWAEHCKKACSKLNIELKVVKVQVNRKDGKGTEAAARHARYHAISKNIRGDEVLLTAHHLQDQAETLMLRLLRGSGSQGLGAMRELSSAHGFKQLRPFLWVPRADLHEYSDAEKLTWINDPSNEKTDFDRNYLRHEIFPLLEKRWPRLAMHLSRSAELLAEEHQCLREQSEIFLSQIQGIDKQTISVSALLQYSKSWRAQILRAWTSSLNAPALPANILREIEQSLLLAKPDARSQVRWADTEITRWRDCLYLAETRPAMPENWQCIWDGNDSFTMPNGDCWGFQSSDPLADVAPLIQSALDGDLLVRLRKGGENIRLANREHHSSIKNCLQELGMPPWERRKLPLIFTAGGECLAMGDVLTSARFKVFCELHQMRFSRRP